MNLTLYRLQSGPSGTFGVLFDDIRPLCNTKEPIIPIIPPGKYNCKPHSGPNHKNVWEITEVKGHTAVLIHVGNYLRDTKGCVLVGLGFGQDKGEVIVTQSGDAIKLLRQYLPKTFTLEVKDSTKGK